MTVHICENCYTRIDADSKARFEIDSAGNQGVPHCADPCFEIVKRQRDEALGYADLAKAEADKRGRVSGEPLSDWIRRLPLDVDQSITALARVTVCSDTREGDLLVICGECGRVRAMRHRHGGRDT